VRDTGFYSEFDWVAAYTSLQAKDDEVSYTVVCEKRMTWCHTH
jgi:hypothetical protein